MGAWEKFLEEDAHIQVHVKRMRELADGVGELPMSQLRTGVEDLYDFLSHRLLPHIAVEERVLYPAIARVDGLREAVAAMSRDHREVGELTRELAPLRDRLETEDFWTEQAKELRRVLYSLNELLRMHLAKEEEIGGG